MSISDTTVETCKRLANALTHFRMAQGCPSGMNADQEHIRAEIEFIRPHKNVIDYELLPYHRFGLGKYQFLGWVYELNDYQTPSAELVAHLQTIIDEAFGRTGSTQTV